MRDAAITDYFSFEHFNHIAAKKRPFLGSLCRSFVKYIIVRWLSIISSVYVCMSVCPVVSAVPYFIRNERLACRSQSSLPFCSDKHTHTHLDSKLCYLKKLLYHGNKTDSTLTFFLHQSVILVNKQLFFKILHCTLTIKKNPAQMERLLFVTFFLIWWLTAWTWITPAW